MAGTMTDATNELDQLHRTVTSHLNRAMWLAIEARKAAAEGSSAGLITKHDYEQAVNLQILIQNAIDLRMAD